MKYLFFGQELLNAKRLVDNDGYFDYFIHNFVFTVAQVSDLCFMANQRFAPQWRKSRTCADMKINYVTGLLALFTLATFVPVPHLFCHSIFILRGEPRSWILCGFFVPLVVLSFYHKVNCSGHPPLGHSELRRGFIPLNITSKQSDWMVTTY